MSARQDKQPQQSASGDLREGKVKGPLGLVLSGGGARGAFQVGVWKVLREEIPAFRSVPEIISGTSAGALNGALIAGGLGPDDLMAFWIDLAEDPPVIGNRNFFSSLFQAIFRVLRQEPLRPLRHRKREWHIFRKLFSKHAWFQPSGQLAMLVEYLMTARFDSISDVLEEIRTPYLFDTGPVRERLRKALGRDELVPQNTKLAINTVDVRTGNVVRIVNASPAKRSHAASQHYMRVNSFSLDMLLASASIPLLFNPIEVRGQSLWDGGVLVNTPLAPAVALGARQIVPVVVTLREAPPNYDLHRFGHALERLADAFLENAYNIDRKLLLERNMLARERQDDELIEVTLYRAIRPSPGQLFNAGSYLYFERDALIAMYDAGQAAARAWLAQGPMIDRREYEE